MKFVISGLIAIFSPLSASAEVQLIHNEVLTTPVNQNPTTQKNISNPGLISSTSKITADLIRRIPDPNLRSGLEEYHKMVDPEAYTGSDQAVGASNKGLSKYFERRFSSNKCFQAAAVDFYQDVAKTLQKENSCMPTKIIENGVVEDLFSNSLYGCSIARPSLNDFAGAGKKSHLPEGWLYRLALKHARGSAEGALDLIGMCGHDDIAQGHFEYFDSSEKGRQKYEKNLLFLQTERKKTLDKIKKEYSQSQINVAAKNKIKALNDDLKFFESAQQELLKQNKIGVTEQLSCPHGTSDFFLPGSLGSEVEIPSALKEKIKTIQRAAGSEQPARAAKHYHIYGSALLGCKMAAKGMTPQQSSLVQTQAARLYRGIRMCDAAAKLATKRDDIMKYVGNGKEENPEILLDKALRLWEKSNKEKWNCDNLKPANAYLESAGGTAVSVGGNILSRPEQNFKADKCEALFLFGINHFKENQREIVVRKIKRQLQRIDAASLYQQWYFGGGTVAGKKIPCTDLRYKGPKNLLNPDQGIFGQVFKPRGWDATRYASASRELATFDVDFEWTIAQHRVGSQFGAEACASQRGRPTPFNDRSCEGSGSSSEFTESTAPNKASSPKGVD